MGFIGGFGGLLNGQHFLVDRQDKEFLRGSAGFDYLGTDRTKITTEDQLDQVAAVLRDVDLDALIVVGGDDSNTNAAYLARAIKDKCQIIGVPKTIDGDLQWYPFLAVTFGFHSASQHYASLVNALQVDACATKKYIHLVKLMGRSASHVALEVAHQVEPHGCLLAEEVVSQGWGLADVIDYFVSVMKVRVAAKKSYGVLVFPEGLAEVIPEMKAFLNGDLGPLSDYLKSLHCDVGFQEAVAEDAHGNKNLSLMPFEVILKQCLSARLQDEGITIPILSHFFGYEGRSNAPTEFDSAYSRLLGKTAYELVLAGTTGVMATCFFQDDSVQPCGLPLGALLTFDEAKGRWVIKKTMVDLESRDFHDYTEHKDQWVMQDPGFPRKPRLETPRRFVI